VTTVVGDLEVSASLGVTKDQMARTIADSQLMSGSSTFIFSVAIQLKCGKHIPITQGVEFSRFLT
jgi:xanthine/uracil permease